MSPRPGPRAALIAVLLALVAAPVALAAPVPLGGSPLNVFVDSRGQLQAFLSGSTDGIFFYNGNQTGDAGFFLAFPNTDGGISEGSVFGFAGSQGPSGLTDYTEVSSGSVTGSGTAGSPLQQVTTYAVQPGATPLLTVTQTTTYVNGSQEFGVHWNVHNDTDSAIRFKALAAADFYFGGDDAGTGIFTAGPPRFIGGTNADTGTSGGFLEVLGGPSPAWSHYQALDWPDVWTTHVETAGTSTPTFDDTVVAVQGDNAGGVEWDDRLTSGLAAGADATYELIVGYTSGTVTPVTPTAPDTTGSGPSGLIKDKTPTFTFSSTDAGASFQCSVDGGAFSACTSPYTVSGLSAGPHTFSVRAVSAAGVVDPTPASISFTVAQALGDLPSPTLGSKVNVATVKGTVLVGTRSGGRVRYVPLDQAKQIGVGSFLDTRRGTVRLVTATGSGKKTQSGDFSLGLFKVLQSKKKSAKGLTELPLQGGDFRSCGRARGASLGVQAAASKKAKRRLRGVAKGKYRTKGRNASATVRGTDWTLTDRCDGTLTQVRRGRVEVRDFVRKRTVFVRAGKSYLAKARR